MSRIMRDLFAVTVIVLTSGFIAASPALEIIRGVSLDVLMGMRWHLFGSMSDPGSSPTVVVAIDEESYQTSPFKGSPTLTWTPEIGRVLTEIVGGGARVVGFDVIFPTSIEQSEILFANEALGTRMRGFDRDFLRALALGSSAGKVLLGEIHQRNDSIGRHPGSGLP